jgi:hypothetical protein
MDYEKEREYKGGNVADPWNSGFYKDDPTKPWNDTRYKDDPTKPWNSNGATREEY